jgi:hypothetical protein
VSFDPSSRARLNEHDLLHFQEPTLFHHIARVLCHANCIPRKELFESWEFARRTRRRYRGGRIVDLACGHGLVAHLLLLLDDTSPTALAADRRLPDSAAKVAEALAAAWPRLAGRVSLVEQRIAQVEVHSGDLIVAAHACGGLTDEVLSKAIAVSARVVVLPCCQATGKNDCGGMQGWLDPDLAIDVTRAARLRSHGYSVHTQHLPEAITAKNRLLFGEPAAA